MPGPVRLLLLCAALALMPGRVAAAAAEPPAGAADARVRAAEAVELYRAGRIAEARAIWEELAATGDARALYNLATLHLNGLGGLARDREKALALLRQAADAGEAMAAYRLAVLLLEDPDAGETARLEAIRRLTEAARAGLPAAQYRLALAYWKGEGLARDPVAAYLWMARAASRLDIARRALSGMEQAMTPAELTRARARLTGGRDEAQPGDDGAWRLQLVALGSRADVESFWQRLKARAPDLVAGLEPAILPARHGRLHRLQIGPFPSRAAAERRCAALKSAGYDCLLVKAPAPQ